MTENPSSPASVNPYRYANNSWPNETPGKTLSNSTWLVRNTGIENTWVGDTIDAGYDVGEGLANVVAGLLPRPDRAWDSWNPLFLFPGYTLGNDLVVAADRSWQMYRQQGLSRSEASAGLVLSFLPVAGKLVEILDATSYQPHNFGHHLTRKDYLRNGLGIGVDTALLLKPSWITPKSVLQGVGSIPGVNRLPASQSIVKQLTRLEDRLAQVAHQHSNRLVRNTAWLATKTLGTKACFAAGTPLLVEGGWQWIERIQTGDRVLSRNQWVPTSPNEYKMVEDVFVRIGKIWRVHVGGQVIETTPEHPIFIERTGDFVPVSLLQVGDRFYGQDGRWVQIDQIEDTGRYDTVYNLRVADYHTYFVGSTE